jgi:hypothetical protein
MDYDERTSKLAFSASSNILEPHVELDLPPYSHFKVITLTLGVPTVHSK